MCSRDLVLFLLLLTCCSCLSIDNNQHRSPQGLIQRLTRNIDQDEEPPDTNAAEETDKDVKYPRPIADGDNNDELMEVENENDPASATEEGENVSTFPEEEEDDDDTDSSPQDGDSITSIPKEGDGATSSEPNMDDNGTNREEDNPDPIPEVAGRDDDPSVVRDTCKTTFSRSISTAITDNLPLCSAALLGTNCISSFSALQNAFATAADYSTIVLCPDVSIPVSSQLDVVSNHTRLCCGVGDVVDELYDKGISGTEERISEMAGVKDRFFWGDSPFDAPRCMLDATGHMNRVLKVLGRSFMLEGVALINGTATENAANSTESYCKDGGNIDIRGAGHHFIKNSLFKGGSAAGVPEFSGCFGGNLRGDGFGISPLPNLTVVNSLFMDGVATTKGGGMLIDDMDKVEFHNCIFQNNTALGVDGGAVSFNEIHQVVFDHTKWVNNTSVEGIGGALVAVRQGQDRNNTVTIRCSEFVGNKAKHAGSSVYVSKEKLGGNDFVSSINSLFDGNIVSDFKSGTLVL